MISGDIVVLRPAAQNVAPGVSLPAGPQGLQGPPGKNGADGAPGAPGSPGVIQAIEGVSKPSVSLDDIGAASQYAVTTAVATKFDKAGGTITGPVTASDVVTASGANAVWTTFNSAVANPAGFPTPPTTGAKIHRLNDRVFVGAATVNSGDFPSTTNDWYEALEKALIYPQGCRTSWAQLASISTYGGIGVLGAARTSDANVPGFQLGMGGLFAAYNDNTTAQQLATALYAVAFRKAGAGVGTGVGTVGAEVDIANLGNSVQILPSNLYPSTGFTTALQVNSGAIAAGATSASAAITIGANGANFLSGIVFGQTAISGLTYDGSGNVTGGTASAVRMSAFHQLEWFNTQGGVPTSKIVSRQLTPANAQEIAFQDDGIVFGGGIGTGRSFEALYVGASTGAYLTVAPAFGTTPATLSLAGATNADLSLQPVGAGKLILGKGTSVVGTAGTLLGYIPIGVSGDANTYKIPIYKNA